MKTRQTLIFLIMLSALLLQACGANAQSAIATGIAQTQQISALETAAAGGGGAAQVQPPAEVAQPSNTPAPSVALVSVSQNTNCRSGPRQDYNLLTTINVGQQVEVLKIFSNDYAVVKNPNGSGDCWLFLQFANTIDFSAFNLAVATQPPAPAPTFNWNGSWHMFYAVGGLALDFGPVTLTQTGTTLTGSFTYNDVNNTILGTLSSDFQTATGIITNTTSNKSFPIHWQIKSGNLNQFVGSYVSEGTTYAWCGARAGASRPNPCQWP
jgi:hypothetical protein